ncbi:hypothetical protein F5887DRAFT_221169 [Amanita rubescens]|nr:hypothetical protein F5887DRAFT_221169 [Amanita rubescens]
MRDITKKMVFLSQGSTTEMHPPPTTPHQSITDTVKSSLPVDSDNHATHPMLYRRLSSDSLSSALSPQIDLEYLQKYISEGALHDSMARFPPPMCHPQSREKVLKLIADWVEDPHVRQPIMWVNGPAGGGKSAIAQTIAGRCSGEQLAASFFFLRNGSDRGTAARLFTTLAWQLAKNIPELLPYIESAIKAEPLFPTKSLDIQFDCLIVQPLQELLCDKPGFYPQRSLVIIDGVDECAFDQDQMLFLRLIGDTLSKTHIPLRFLICSRPEPHIQATFESEVMTRVTNSVSLNDQFEPHDDIRRYLKDEFARIRAGHKLSSGWPPSTAIDQLTSKSFGLFIYAFTVVKFVEDIYDDPKSSSSVDDFESEKTNSSANYSSYVRLFISQTVISRRIIHQYLTSFSTRSVQGSILYIRFGLPCRQR